MKRRFLHTPEAVGAAVRDRRIELNLTQAQLAENAGVGRRFVVSLEAGHRRAELDKVLSVLHALDIHATALPGPPSRQHLTHDFDLDTALDAYQHGGVYDGP